MATNPEPVAATPSTQSDTPLLTGGFAAVQVVPPSLLAHTPIVCVVTVRRRPLRPVRLCWVRTPPSTSTLPPCAATLDRLTTRPPPVVGNCSAAPDSRRQVRPAAEVHSTGVVPLLPMASQPGPAAASEVRWSPARSGIPVPLTSVQAVPSLLAQTAPVPTASQPSGPPASNCG